jgi:hypothetical protein
MAVRLVPNENARSAAAAEAFVVSDSGGTVIPTGETARVNGGWAVQVYSTDGLCSPPTARGRVLFKVISVDQGKAHVRDRAGFEFDVSQTLPAYLPSFPGETISLQPGQTLSCEIEPGTQDGLKDVVIESELRERREFEGFRYSRMGTGSAVLQRQGITPAAEAPRRTTCSSY